MQRVTMQLETLTCPSCLQKIENATKNLDGIDAESIKALFNARKVRTNFDDDVISIEKIEKVIETLGYEVEKLSVRTA